MGDLTLDQRLERLVERHEALTQSVESLAATSRETSDLVRSLVESSKETTGLVKETAGLVRSLFEVAAADGEHIRGLARIAEIHERRLTALEGGEDGEK